MSRHFFKYSVILILVVLSFEAYAQKAKPKNSSWYDDKLLHFGFSIGFNSLDFITTASQQNYKIDSLYPEVSFLKPGINIQVIIDYKPFKYFDVRFLPGVSFGQRDLIFYKGQELYDDKQKLESSFLEFPLLLKTKGSRLNNFRPYLVGGLNFRYDLAGRKEYDDSEAVYLRLHRADLYYEIGAGLDIYLPFFKLAVELKLANGMRDVLVRDPAPGYPQYVNAIESLRSQIWVLAFHFE
ncbi:MAG: porin family protein [Marinilabiliaceae bacterium]|nr:porin family protein [Marinilabiliaceae bacterium]